MNCNIDEKVLVPILCWNDTCKYVLSYFKHTKVFALESRPKTLGKTWHFLQFSYFSAPRLPDDSTSRRRRRRQPAAARGMPRSPARQPRRSGEVSRPGEASESPGLARQTRSGPLQPCVPTKGRLPAVQRTQGGGSQWEVRALVHRTVDELWSLLKDDLSKPNVWTSKRGSDSFTAFWLRALSGFLPSM